MPKLPKAIAIVGPTASGKTALAVEIARAVGGEVISCDSRQVYRGLDLGSGKATKKEMCGVPHHLLSVASPRGTFTAARFENLALRVARDILKRGKVPVLCGGTGHYVDALVYGGLPEVPPNPALRRRLAKLTAAEMHAELARLDPDRAAEIDAANPRRLERAIEIAAALGAVPKLTAREPRFEVLWVGVAPEKEDLHARIEKRLDVRLRQGLVAEAKRLRAAGLSWTRFAALGLEYGWLARHLKGEVTRQEMRDGLLADIRRYAKRQMTWFRRNPKIAWHRPSKARDAVTAAKKFLM